ncbi:MAG: FKBP-type peptidyl-prolyl cis-trans isomerase [Gemmatimonadota bacterium]
MFARRLLATTALTLVASSCMGSDSTGPLDPADATFATSLGVDLSAMTRTDTGLYYQDLVEGDGEVAEEGGELTVHYTGWLRDGTRFDTSRQEGRGPFSFTLGAREVIAGWDEGLEGMRVGGERKLVIPSWLGYGSAPYQSIPANSILVFEVELLAASPAPPEEEPN